MEYRPIECIVLIQFGMSCFKLLDTIESLKNAVSQQKLGIVNFSETQNQDQDKVNIIKLSISYFSTISILHGLLF